VQAGRRTSYAPDGGRVRRASGSKAELAASAKVLGKGASTGSKSSTKIEARDGDRRQASRDA
jgi:hypothetical protein